MSVRYGARSRPATMVSTWLNDLDGTTPQLAGYFGGGNNGLTTVNKVLFADDSRTTLGTGLSTAVRNLAGFANSGTAGYFAGGDDGVTSYTTVNKFAFSDDSRTTLGTGLSIAPDSLAGMATAGTI